MKYSIYLKKYHILNTNNVYNSFVKKKRWKNKKSFFTLYL